MNRNDGPGTPNEWLMNALRDTALIVGLVTVVLAMTGCAIPKPPIYTTGPLTMVSAAAAQAEQIQLKEVVELRTDAAGEIIETRVTPKKIITKQDPSWMHIFMHYGLNIVEVAAYKSLYDRYASSDRDEAPADMGDQGGRVTIEDSVIAGSVDSLTRDITIRNSTIGGRVNSGGPQEMTE